MNGTVAAILSLLLAAGVALFAAFGPRISEKAPAERYTVTEPYSYPVKPGTAEWEAMSIEERLEACSVDRSLAESMDTNSLLKTVLEYPFMVDIGFYDGAGKGVDIVRAYFAPLDELLKRPEAADTLRDYLSAVEEGGNVKDVDYVLETHYHIARDLAAYLGAV